MHEGLQRWPLRPKREPAADVLSFKDRPATRILRQAWSPAEATRLLRVGWDANPPGHPVAHSCLTRRPVSPGLRNP